MDVCDGNLTFFFFFLFGVVQGFLRALEWSIDRKFPHDLGGVLKNNYMHLTSS
jgi:hypothetical protein